MKPKIKLGRTLTPDGSCITLHQHDQDYFIEVDYKELMCSRRTESELQLGRLGCKHLAGKQSAKVLIGGLGMGYTVRATLDVVPKDATVIVVELLPEVVRWNQEIIGHLANFPLEDKRVQVITQDVFEVIKNATSEFDAILLDVDNGPHLITDSINGQIYKTEGLETIRKSLNKEGRLSIWSAHLEIPFEKRLEAMGFKVDRFEVPAYRGKKARCHYIWVVG